MRISSLTQPSPARGRALVILAFAALLVAGPMGTVPAANAAVISVTCNNITTDDTIVQTAINGSSVADVIQIHGPCLFDATVTLRDERSYVGDGRGATIIKMADGANLKALLATATWSGNNTFPNSAIRLAHLTLDGNRANNAAVPAGGAVMQFRAWNSLIEDVEIMNGDRDGIRVSNASDNGTALSNSSVNTTVRDFFIHDVTEVGFHVVDAGGAMTDWNLEDGWVAYTGSGFDAVNLENAAGWTVRNLHIYGVSTDAIDARRCYGTRITDNYIEDFGGQGSAGVNYRGIYCTAQGDASSVLTGNAVHHFGALPANGNFRYIEVAGNYGTPLVSVVGNTVRGAASSPRETGLYYGLDTATSMTVVSTGNAVAAVGASRTATAGVTVSAGY